VCVPASVGQLVLFCEVMKEVVEKKGISTLRYEMMSL
jgi:hypothetical protein